MPQRIWSVAPAASEGTEQRPDLCELGAPVGGVLQQILLLDDVNDGGRHRAAQRIAAIRAACVTYADSSQLLLRLTYVTEQARSTADCFQEMVPRNLVG